MVRLKFLLFAFLVLGLGLAHLLLLSGPLGASAVQGATERASSGVSEVSRQLESRRVVARDAALTLAASPRLHATLDALVSGSSLEPLTDERFGPIRKAAENALPKELTGVVVAVVANGQAGHARLRGEPAMDATLDLQGLARAGGVQVADAFGAPHVFASVPVLWDVMGLEPTVMATLVVGVPLGVEGALDAAVSASGVSALLLVKGETLVASAGPEKALAEGSLAKLTEGPSGTVLRQGEMSLLGPVKLPVLTQGDALGGRAPLTVGTRRAVAGTPYQVVSLASTQPALGLLADYQTKALLGLASLLGLSLVWTLLMGSGRSAASPEAQQGDTLGLAPGAQPAQAAPAAELSASAESAPPEGEDAFPFPPAPAPVVAGTLEPASAAASADDFPFAPPPAVPAARGAEDFPFPPAPAPVAANNGFPFPTPGPETTAPYSADSMPPMSVPPEPMPFDPPAPPVATAGPREGAYPFEAQATAAYSIQQAADPFALASAAQASAQPDPFDDDGAEATRVAAIPRELLQAAVRQAEASSFGVAGPRQAAPPPPTTRSMMGTPPAPVAVPLPGAGNAVALTEEQHFQDVFREFISTRERCSEPADGLTYDKFVAKLRKNKEQLVQKYACKTVRFQVYVKEGKAALKATPVKE